MGDLMGIQETIIMYMEIIGAIAFAISGAMVGIRLGMDMFGVTVLGCCTAVGGGMCRDVILGNFPAFMENPRYFWLAALTSLVVFLAIYFNKENLKSIPWHKQHIIDSLLNLTDAIGLAAFSVVGVLVTRRSGYNSYFVMIFMGVLTAAGGGLLRDTMAGVKPYIFTKHIYALASAFGATVFIIICEMGHEFAAVVISCSMVIILRLLAARFHWGLPKIKVKR